MKGWLIFQCAVLKGAGLVLIFLADWAVFGWFVFLSGGLLVVFHLFSPRAQGFCDVDTGFIPRGKQVWLTIDDGPDPVDTPRILDLLDAHSAKATFFMIGQKATRHPEIVRAVLARGHTIGSHTDSHPVADFWFAGRKRTNRELDQSLTALNCLGACVQLFRSPVGIKNFFLRHALESRGLRCVAWSTRSGDCHSRDLEAIVDRIAREVRPGSIILMHEGVGVPEEFRVVALGKVLAALKKHGFSCIVPPVESMQL